MVVPVGFVVAHCWGEDGVKGPQSGPGIPALWMGAKGPGLGLPGR